MLRDYSHWDTVYKLIIKKDSIMTISWVNNTAGLAIKLYSDKNCTDEFSTIYAISGPKKGRACRALGKGTYWITFSDLSDNYEQSRAKFKLDIEASVNRPNYCAAKAISLASGKTIKIAQTPFHRYDRWYKIKLDKKKQIKIVTTYGGPDYVYIYDSDLNYIDTMNGSTTRITEKKQPKGTYYICVDSQYNIDYLEFKWK